MKIICIANNYAQYAKEIKHEVPDKPVFFLKPDSAILRNNNPFFIPGFSNEIHYEVEIVLKINRLGKGIQQKYAHRYYSEIGIGIDFTARDIQRNCKEKGLPWEIAKAFDSSAAIGMRFIDKTNLPDVNAINFYLNINGKAVQHGCSSDMLFKFDELIAYISTFMTLRTGDLIYTGTPPGVGPVNNGDRLQAYLENELLLDFLIK
jgi:2-keto-4-pentenoate hydratase/2-oxohepta-3-ene-1,7-dioic acid hydratase in catechol pathway